MADNVTFQTTAPATPPDATKIATDDAGANGHVQIVKLAISADGSATVIPADATNGIDVDVTRVSGTVTVQDSAAEASLALIDDVVATDGAAAPTKATMVAGTDGTNAQIISVDTNGYQEVSIKSSLTLPVSGGFSEDAAHASGASGHLVLGVRNDSAVVQTSADGDYGALALDSAGRVGITDLGGAISIDDAGGSLTVDGTVAVSSLAAGDNNIGNVDIVTMPGMFEEDQPHTSADLGMQVLTVRKNTAAATSGTDGDYQPLTTDGSGRLHVNVGNSLTVAGTGTFQVQESGAALTALQLIDNLVLAEDAVHGSGDPGVQSLAVRKDIGASLAGTDGDYAPLQVDADGNLRVNIVTGSSSGTQYTEDAASAADPVGNALIMVRKDSLAALTSADGDNVAARGTDKGELYVKHVDAIPVTDNGGNLSIDDGGNSITVDGTITETNSGSALTALQLIDDVVLAEDVAHASGDKGVMSLSVRKDTAAATSGTDGDYQPIITDANGRLHTIEANSASVKTAVEKIDDPVLVDDAAFTPATSSVMMSGFQADETSSDSVDEGDAGAARMTLDRKVIVTPQPHTKGGLAIFRSLDLDETEEDIKTSAGQVYGWFITNRATTPRYIKFYNATAANVTVGTTTPVITMEIPGNSTDHIAANALGGLGIEFDTAISAAATTGFADADTGAPGANDVIINVFYK